MAKWLTRRRSNPDRIRRVRLGWRATLGSGVRGLPAPAVLGVGLLFDTEQLLDLHIAQNFPALVAAGAVGLGLHAVNKFLTHQEKALSHTFSKRFAKFQKPTEAPKNPTKKVGVFGAEKGKDFTKVLQEGLSEATGDVVAAIDIKAQLRAKPAALGGQFEAFEDENDVNELDAAVIFVGQQAINGQGTINSSGEFDGKFHGDDDWRTILGALVWREIPVYIVSPYNPAHDPKRPRQLALNSFKLWRTTNSYGNDLDEYAAQINQDPETTRGITVIRADKGKLGQALKSDPENYDPYLDTLSSKGKGVVVRELVREIAPALFSPAELVKNLRIRGINALKPSPRYSPLQLPRNTGPLPSASIGRRSKKVTNSGTSS